MAKLAVHFILFTYHFDIFDAVSIGFIAIASASFTSVFPAIAKGFVWFFISFIFCWFSALLLAISFCC